MKQQLYPLLFEPVYKDYIWGGTKMASRFNRRIPIDIAAESWEIADRPEGMSIVRNGPLAGMTLRELAGLYGRDLIGRDRDSDAFPLLIKIIDAEQRLSVQVHPDESSAGSSGGEPKTEAWFVLDAEPGAAVYAGFRRPSSEAEFREALSKGNVEQLLQPIPARPGELIFIPGGRVHCIGEGCLLLEVQQNSNTTYRVYDWGRLGNDGKPRELHLEEAMRVIRWDDTGAKSQRANAESSQPGFHELLRCPHFRIERMQSLKDTSYSTDGRNFHALFVASGRIGVVSRPMTIDAGPGTSVLIPAGAGEYALQGSQAELIRMVPA